MMRKFLHFLIYVVPMLLIACAGSGLEMTGVGKKLPRELTFWQPWLLYTSGKPYASLYVEVDAVTGVEPEQKWLDEFRSFLATTCRKPGGVKVVRSDVIPRDVAAQASSSALALRYINGPPGDAAYIYVLYYDSTLNGNLKTVNPHAVVFPYPCAIFIDRNYNEAGFGDRLGGLVLLHEGGHLVGAARDKKHGDGVHCHYKYCLMNPAFDYNPLRRFIGMHMSPQQSFCPFCKAELLGYKTRVASSKLSFAGPMLIRNEGNYQVLALPNSIHLHFGPSKTMDRTAVLRNLRSAGAKSLRSKEGFIMSGAAIGPMEEVQKGMLAAKSDPAEAVRIAARLMLDKLPPPVAPAVALVP